MDEEDPPDELLVQRCLAGDGPAWALLVRRYQRLVHTVVLRMGLDEHVAADVFQATFERLWRHLPRLEAPGRVRAWLVTTARREALQQRERQRRDVPLDAESADGTTLADTLADDAPGAEAQLEALQTADRVRHALDTLGGRCRALLLALHADEPVPSYGEVSARLGLPVGSIGPTRARCLDKLRALLRGPGGGS